MSRESSPRSKRWKVLALKLAGAAAVLVLARVMPIAGTIGLLLYLAAVVKPAASTSGRH